MRAELDSHVDTCAFVLICKIIYDMGKTVFVDCFNDHTTMRLKHIKIGLVTVAYDCPHTHITLLFCSFIRLYTFQ
jgi:hypothetical protein